MFIRDGVGVLEVEVVAARLHLVRSHLPGNFVLHAAFALRSAPPIHAGFKVLDANGPGHRVGLLALGHTVLVEPDFLGGRALLKEQQVGADAGIGLEDAVGQPDDGVQVALFHQMFFQPRLDAFAKERSIGQDHGGAAIGFEHADDERQKEIGGFAGLEVLGEVALDAVFLTPAKGRIGENDLHAVRLRVADVGPGQRIVVADKAGVLDAVQAAYW